MKLNNDLPQPMFPLPQVSEADYYAEQEEEDSRLVATGAFPDDEVPDPSRKILVRFKKLHSQA
jgi:hypothetical protein